MSMMKFGLLNDRADVMKVFQSLALAGEKSFVPTGQLFFCVAFRTGRHPVHFISAPAE
jgi:hypothetical protein